MADGEATCPMMMWWFKVREGERLAALLGEAGVTELGGAGEIRQTKGAKHDDIMMTEDLETPTGTSVVLAAASFMVPHRGTVLLWPLRWCR